MLCRVGAIITLALVTLPQGAIAAEYMVRIFPATIYVQSGDTIRFRNMTSSTRTVRAENASWATDPLAEDEEYVLTISNGTTRNFSLEEDSDYSGAFSFAPAPVYPAQ